MKTKHTTLRLSDIARARLQRLAHDYNSQNAVIEDALETLENSKIAFGQQVQQATAALIAAIRENDQAAIGGAQIALAELLHSLPAAAGIAAALHNELNK